MLRDTEELHAQPPEIEFPHNLKEPVFSFEGNSLYIDRGWGKPPVAEWRGEHAATIDGRAFDILYRHCGGNNEQLQTYLKAILAFEMKYSDDEYRHQHRLPVEQEILGILKEGGYFKL